MPRPRVAMRRIKEVLRLKHGLGLSDTAVSRSVRIARSTVKDYLDRAAAAGLNWEITAELSEEELDRRLFAAADTRHPGRALPDWEAVEKELRGRGVTLRLLWLEYLGRHPEGYRYTQFCAHFHAWQRRSRPPTMRRQHRAGEALEVDWAGMTLSIIDQGVVRQAQVFVACLPCSDLTYAEASWTQGHEDWLGAHVRAFAYIGGCPQKLIPDNTKTGVTDANYWDPVLNRSYHALARHYNVAIVPARVRRPRDKPSAENAVKMVEMWVLAPLRHRQFFSLAEANAAIAEKIEEWNNRPLARRSRQHRLPPRRRRPFLLGAAPAGAPPPRRLPDRGRGGGLPPRRACRQPYPQRGQGPPHHGARAHAAGAPGHGQAHPRQAARRRRGAGCDDRHLCRPAARRARASRAGCARLSRRAAARRRLRQGPARARLRARARRRRPVLALRRAAAQGRPAARLPRCRRREWLGSARQPARLGLLQLTFPRLEPRTRRCCIRRSRRCADCASPAWPRRWRSSRRYPTAIASASTSASPCWSIARRSSGTMQRWRSGCASPGCARRPASRTSTTAPCAVSIAA